MYIMLGIASLIINMLLISKWNISNLSNALYYFAKSRNIKHASAFWKQSIIICHMKEMFYESSSAVQPKYHILQVQYVLINISIF